jgi:hypothetical protein
LQHTGGIVIHKASSSQRRLELLHTAIDNQQHKADIASFRKLSDFCHKIARSY